MQPADTFAKAAAKVAAIRALSLQGRIVYALKVGSWPKLFAPFVLGQAIGVREGHGFSVLGLVLGLVFTTLDVTYIVLLNDWGDQEVDAIKRRRFPDGCSPKTIPDGILPAQALLGMGLLAGGLLLAFAWATGVACERPYFFRLSGLSVLVFAIYTFKPLALNYRGGGELLEMFGVGLLLPWLNAYLQSGVLFGASRTMVALAPALAFLALSSALASGISDEESDREGKKRTFATMLGNRSTRVAVECCYLLGAVLLAVVPPLVLGRLVVGQLPAVVLLLACYPSIRRESPAAVTNAFAAQNRFKGRLHLGLWGFQLLLGTSLVVKAPFSVIW
ncbi:MAG: prenyltransferase [Polyangiaceae bacterium]